MSDMFNKPDSDTKLRILRDLYEGGDLEQFDLDGEPRLHEEVDAMREMKALLDARPRMRPSAHVVQSVLNAAAEKSKPEGPRRDRAPSARRSAIHLRVGAVSAVVVVLLSVLTLIRPEFRTATPEAQETGGKLMTQEMSSEAVAPEEAEQPQEMDAAVPQAAPPQAESARTQAFSRSDDLVALAAQSMASERREHPVYEGETQTANSQMVPAGAGDAQAAVADMLAWDQSGEVIEVYQDIEMVGGGVDLGWEPPSVPLEMLPQSRTSRRSVQPAVQR